MCSFRVYIYSSMFSKHSIQNLCTFNNSTKNAMFLIKSHSPYMLMKLLQTTLMPLLWQWHQHRDIRDRKISRSSIQCTFIPIIVNFGFQVDGIPFFKAELSGAFSIEIIQCLTGRHDRRPTCWSCCRRRSWWRRWVWAPSRISTESRTTKEILNAL